MKPTRQEPEALASTNPALPAEISERSRTDEQLRVQATALDVAANAIMITDHNGTIQSVNPAFTTLTGYTAQEAVGQNPRILNSGKQDAAYFRNLWQTISSGRIWSGELINRRKDGSLYTEEMTITSLRNADGTIARYVAIKQDITERKQAEAALRESEDRYRLLVEESPDAIGIYQEGKLVLVNSTGVRQLGAKTREELLGRKSEQIIHPDDLADAKDRIRRRLAGETGMYPAEVRYLRLDGTSVPVEVSAAPITFNGKPAMQFIARDITERKRAEEALRESEERFAAAFEHAPIGVALVSPDGHWLQVNRALCELIGYSEAELLTRTFQDITHPEDLETDLLDARRLRAGEIRSYELEKRYVHQRGHFVTVWLSVSLVRDGQGQPRYFISQIQDITQRKRVESALRESDEKFHQLADHITDAFWIRSPDLREVHYLSPAFERIWGRPRESLYANPQAWEDFILPEDRERVVAAFAALTEAAPSLDIEYRIVRPDGGIRWVRVRGNPGCRRQTDPPHRHRHRHHRTQAQRDCCPGHFKTGPAPEFGDFRAGRVRHHQGSFPGVVRLGRLLHQIIQRAGRLVLFWLHY
jgi:PAS domain S-box-containing protein